MNKIKEDILRKIKSGEVAMRPRWYFVLQTCLWSLGLLISFLIAIYLLSFVMFAFRESGIMLAPLFGFGGIVFLVVNSPWLLISLVLLFMMVLFLLSNHFSFSYRRPLIYSIIGISFLVILISSLLHTVSIHDRMFEFAERHRVPGMQPFYRHQLDYEARGLLTGKVIEMNPSDIVLKVPNGKIYKVNLNEKTRMPRGTMPSVGSVIFVAGFYEDDTTITALGVRLADKPKHRMRFTE